MQRLSSLTLTEMTVTEMRIRMTELNLVLYNTLTTKRVKQPYLALGDEIMMCSPSSALPGFHDLKALGVSLTRLSRATIGSVRVGLQMSHYPSLKTSAKFAKSVINTRNTDWQCVVLITKCNNSHKHRVLGLGTLNRDVGTFCLSLKY